MQSRLVARRLHAREVPRARVLWRCWRLSLAGAGTACAVIDCLVRTPAPQRRVAVYQAVAASIPRFGPAAVKTAQLVATRRDLLPPELCHALSGLWGERVEAVSSADRAHARRMLLQADPALSGSTIELVGAGSIAYVFRVVHPTGAERAVKLLKPDVAEDVRIDMHFLRRLAGIVQALPAVRGVPVKEMIDHLSDAVEAQTDLAQEALNLARLADALATLPHVRVPRPYLGESTQTLLSMEWLPAPESGVVSNAAKAQSIMLLIYQMLFRDGLVHVDLHPGNLHVRGDVVVVHDAGFVMRIDRSTRKALALLFLGLSVADGHACARAVADSSRALPEDFDLAAFATAMQRIVDAHSGARAGDFNLLAFSRALFDVQRRFRVYPSPALVFPLMSLVAIEGQVRDLCPDLDFQQLSVPYVSFAMEN